MERDWTELANPFPNATKAAKEFWETPPQESSSASFEGRDYGHLLEGRLPEEFEEYQRNFEGHYLTFSESLPHSLRELASAMRLLMEGKLQFKDKKEIALITTLGKDFIDEMVDYFDEDKKASEASYAPEAVDETLPDRARYIELLQMIRGRERVIEDFTKKFAKVARQLDADLKYQRSNIPYPPC